MCKCFDGLANCNPALERFARDHEAKSKTLREEIDKIAAQMPDTSALAKLVAPPCARCGD